MILVWGFTNSTSNEPSLKHQQTPNYSLRLWDINEDVTNQIESAEEKNLVTPGKKELQENKDAKVYRILRRV